MKERPTCRVNDEIIIQHVIFPNPEDSRSHQNEREAERAPELGARPTSLGARPGVDPNQDKICRPSSIASEDQGKPSVQCRFDPTVQIQLKRLYNQSPWPLAEETPIHYSLSYFQGGFRVEVSLERITSH